jgi:hypothetical protein
MEAVGLTILDEQAVIRVLVGTMITVEADFAVLDLCGPWFHQ